jgi:predicted ATPase
MTEAHALTLLYADWSAFDQGATPSEKETGAEFLKRLETNLAALPSSGGSLFARHAQSAIILWGQEEALEEGAQRALRFALNLRNVPASMKINEIKPSSLRIAVVTGEVCIEPPGPDGEPQLSGEAMEAARMMIAIAPEGAIAVSQSTFNLAQGVFNFSVLAQLPTRNMPEPEQVYSLNSLKALLYRIIQHGIEGVNTRLVGREVEVKRIRDAFEAATDDRDNTLLSIIGEPGSGKTRLLVETERWRDLINDSTRLFRAQAYPEMLQQPYGLLRRLFMFRFAIQESETKQVVLAKLQAGFERFMGAGCEQDVLRIAALVGLVAPGADQAEDEATAALAEQQALQSLSNFFHAIDKATLRGVIALHLDDIHWADDKSLDAILWLLQENARTRLVVVALASPELLARRPRWGLDVKNSARIDLHPLAIRDARRLVREVLQKAPELPDELRDWIVERSGGNPLYVEELVLALIDNRVIIKDDSARPWQVDLRRLHSVRVPDSLLGLLQNQLISLPLQLRLALQRAAVIGRFFWDAAIPALEPADGIQIQINQALLNLSRRNLIYRQERSSLGSMQEYSFFSDLMHEAAYGSIPAVMLTRYHALVGDWLAGQSPEIPAALAARIADHYERAGQGERAVRYLAQAASEARRLNDFPQARQFLLRAVRYAHEAAPDPGTPDLSVLLYRLGEIYIWLGESLQAQDYLLQSLELARRRNDQSVMAEALARLGWAAYYQVDYERGLPWLEEAVQVARSSGNQPALLLAMRQLGNIVSGMDDYPKALAYYEQSLEIARQLGDQRSISLTLNNLGITAILTGDYNQARLYLEETVQVSEGRGDRIGTALALGNLGINDYMQGEYSTARQKLGRAIELSRMVGSEMVAAESAIWTGLCLAAAGEPEAAQDILRQALRICLNTGQMPLAQGALVGFANLAARQGNPEQAVELLALLGDQSALDDLIRTLEARPLLDKLHGELAPQTFGKAWARGQAMDVGEVLVKLNTW